VRSGGYIAVINMFQSDMCYHEICKSVCSLVLGLAESKQQAVLLGVPLIIILLLLGNATLRARTNNKTMQQSWNLLENYLLNLLCLLMLWLIKCFHGIVAHDKILFSIS
jgi:hypothetical protein